MVRMLSAMAVVAGLVLGAGVAEAAPATYKVSKQWLIVNAADGGYLIPRIQDDYMEVTCKNGNKMTAYEFNDPALVYDVRSRIDGTGVQAGPEFATIPEGESRLVKITVTCTK